MCQHFLRNNPLKPSSPRALSTGILLTILSISSWVKGSTRQLRSSCQVKREAKLYNIVGSSVTPIRFLKVFHMILALPSWSCIHVPCSFLNCVMVFFLKEIVAIAWKKLVHSSPNLILFSVYLLFQYKFLARRRPARWALTIFLRLHSGLYKALISSKASRCRMTVLQLAM